MNVDFVGEKGKRGKRVGEGVVSKPTYLNTDILDILRTYIHMYTLTWYKQAHNVHVL